MSLTELKYLFACVLYSYMHIQLFHLKTFLCGDGDAAIKASLGVPCGPTAVTGVAAANLAIEVRSPLGVLD